VAALWLLPKLLRFVGGVLRRLVGSDTEATTGQGTRAR
jgi:hypothetical protein